MTAQAAAAVLAARSSGEAPAAMARQMPNSQAVARLGNDAAPRLRGQRQTAQPAGGRASRPAGDAGPYPRKLWISLSKSCGLTPQPPMLPGLQAACPIHGHGGNA